MSKSKEVRQAAAVASDALLRKLFDLAPECIKVVASDGRLLRINAAGLRMIEAPSSESVRDAATVELIAPEDRSGWWAHHERVCAGESLIFEFDLIGLRGTRRHMESHASPIVLDDGSPGQLSITRDATERKQSGLHLQRHNMELEETVAARTRELEAALNRLKDSERSFELLVESVTDYAIYMLDLTGNIVSWNSGARRIKGYDSSEIIGKHFSCFYSEQDRVAGIPMSGLRTAAREGRMETEGWRLRKDGSRFWANVIIDAIRTNGELVGFAKVTRDITEPRAAEARIRQAQKMEAVGQFTGGAAHDFNNLLMAILGSLEMLRKRLPDDPRIRSLRDNAVLGAKRGTSLTQRMLAFARRQELKTETVSLRELIAGMDELLQRSVGPLVNLEVRPLREPVYVRTDANQLETALLNLAVNGRDAMARGGSLVIAVTKERIDSGHVAALAPGEYACISITDSGAGMDEATLAKATEPFFTTKGVGKGTGLGLSMVDGLAGQSGGRLTLRSKVGEGTTVCVWLPTAPAEAPAAVGEGVAAPTRITKALHVLVVDDDPLVLSNVEAMLEDLGHVVTTASCGATALVAVAADPALDLVISDQAMPGMTGLQLWGSIVRSRPDLPFILTSGYSEVSEKTDSSIARLAKPYTQQALSNMIAGALADFDQRPRPAS